MGPQALLHSHGGKKIIDSGPQGLMGMSLNHFNVSLGRQRKQGLSGFRRDFIMRVKDAGNIVAVINGMELFH